MVDQTLDLQVGDRRGRRKKWKFAFASFILEKVQWVLEAIEVLAIFTLGSYVLPICFLLKHIIFPAKRGVDSA